MTVVIAVVIHRPCHPWRYLAILARLAIVAYDACHHLPDTGECTYTCPHCMLPAPIELPMAHHILGCRPANLFCQINSDRRNGCCKTCHRPCRAVRLPCGSLLLCIASPTGHSPSPNTGDLAQAPTPCCSLGEHAPEWQIGSSFFSVGSSF